MLLIFVGIFSQNITVDPMMVVLDEKLKEHECLYQILLQHLFQMHKH